MRHDVSSPSQEEVALLDVSMPHLPPVSDGEMYADTGWFMPHQSGEPSHPVPSCQASIVVLCDHVVSDVLLRSSLQPRAGLNCHRSVPNDHTGQPQPVCGTLLAYQPSPPIEYVHQGRLCSQVDYPPVFSPQSSNCSDDGDNVPNQSQNDYLDSQTDVQVLVENISDYDYDDSHSHSSLDDENTHCHDSDYQHGYPLDPFTLIDHSDLDSSWNSDQDSWFSQNSPDHLPVPLENPLQRLVLRKQCLRNSPLPTSQLSHEL